MPSMGSGQYTARPEAMRSAAGNVGGIIVRASGTLLAFEQLNMDPVSFGSIGSAVGSAGGVVADEQASALHSLLSVLQTVSSRVQISADSYQNADAAVAASYGGGPAAARPERRIWSSPAGAALGDLAASDGSVGSLPTPHRAENVIGYLAGADGGQRGQGEPPLCLPIGSAGDLTAWLAGSPDNQAVFGVIAVYAGAARGLDDTPGGLLPGDLVAIEPGTDATDRRAMVGVVGYDGCLHNHGRFSPDLGGVAQVHVYRRCREGNPEGGTT
jgi:hypothetical protein